MKMNYQLFKIIIIGSIGTLIEWAEYAFYGYMTVQIAKLFFPHQDPRIAILSTLGIFAAGFIMRPLGAIVLGHVADSSGRKIALMYSMIIMGIATFSIGILPSYQTVGFIAPVLLLLCRLLQGFAVASELLGASVFLIEHSHKQNQILAGSFPGLAAGLGITIGGMAGIYVTHSDQTWAWRVPFLLGGISCYIGLYLRQKITESPLFLDVYTKNQLHKIPLLQLLKGFWIPITKTATTGVFVATMVYVCNLYYATYLIDIGKLSSQNALLITTIGELLVVIFFPFSAVFATRWGSKGCMRLGLLLCILSGPIIFMLGKTGNLTFAFLGQLIYALLDAMITAPMFKWMYDQFPTSIRVTGISVSWNLAVALLGGTSPLIVQYLVNQLSWDNAPGFYVSFSAFVMLIVMNLRTSKI